MKRRKVSLVAAVAVVLIGGIIAGVVVSQPGAGVSSQHIGYHVPGENYQVCAEQSKYLTSPWTYDALKSGSRSYTVAQYEALPGYGTKLPPLPSYIASE